jgi:hypothetical protein
MDTSAFKNMNLQSWTYVRNNKQLLFALMGLAGGALGALVAEIAPDSPSSMAVSVFQVAVWSALAASFITTGLFLAGEFYNRRPVAFPILRKGLLTGLIAGGIAGGIAQAVYSVQSDPSAFKDLVLRPLCWGLMGAILGWRLSVVVPNLGTRRGVAAGGIGGVVGGIGFLIVCSILPEGLAIVTVEALFRDASLEIIWAPKETTSITLGPKPIYIGGGDDHVHVAGLPQHAAGVVHEQGKIQYIDFSTSKRTDLKDGSRIKVGRIEVVVHAKK